MKRQITFIIQINAFYTHLIDEVNQIVALC